MANPQHHLGNFKGRYLGLDLSLNSTGVAEISETHLEHYRWRPPEDMRGAERLAWYDKKITMLLHGCSYTAVVIEGYAYGRSNRAHQAGELGGVIRLALWRNRPGAVYVVAPSTHKKFVTGHGGSPKALIPLHLFKRWGLTVEQEDEADAVGLALMGVYRHSRGLEEGLINPQREALAKMEPEFWGVRRRYRS